MYYRLSSSRPTFCRPCGGVACPIFARSIVVLDLLMIDDVQFFAGKPATISELLHTMEALLRDSRQLVLAADRSAAELLHMGAELSARIAGGLCANFKVWILPRDVIW